MQCNTVIVDKQKGIDELSARPIQKQLNECTGKISESMSLTLLAVVANSSASKQEVTSRIQQLIKIEDAHLSYKNKFIFKLFLLEDYLSQNGGRIATHYIEGNEKTEIFRAIQKILRELDFYSGLIDGDRLKTRETLLKFQESYNRKLDKENKKNRTKIPHLQPLGLVGYRTLEALRAWSRKNTTPTLSLRFLV